jgi:hypothetical protein
MSWPENFFSLGLVGSIIYEQCESRREFTKCAGYGVKNLCRLHRRLSASTSGRSCRGNRLGWNGQRGFASLVACASVARSADQQHRERLRINIERSQLSVCFCIL